MKIDLSHLEVLCDNATVSLLITDIHQHCVYMNRSARMLIGASRASTHEPCLQGLIHFSGHENAIERALQGDAQQGEAVLRHHDGYFHDVAYRISPMHDGGAITGTVIELQDISARKHWEAEARDTRERFELVACATNDVIWDWHLASRRLQWSSAAMHLFGCTREELSDSLECWNDRVHPDDLDRVNQTVQAAIDGDQESWTEEYRFRVADGSYALFLDRGIIRRDASGNAVRMIGSIQDLSERLSAEQSLLESEHRYRQLADSMPHLVWTAGPDGIPDYYNARADRYRLQQCPDGSWDWQDALHPDDLERTSAVWREAVANASPYSCEHLLAMADGSYRLHLSRGEPRFDAGGAVVKWFGTATDIHDLHESEARFGALADNMSQLAWMADEGGNAYWYNRRWVEYTGKPAEEMLGLGWKSVHHPDQLDRVIAKVDHSIATDDPLEDMWQLRAQDGSYRWFLIRALPIRGVRGRLSWFGTATDITTQRDAEEALREADRRKDEFLSMLAHELRNPLAPIRNALHIIDSPAATADAQRRAREIIGRQFAHMVRLVDDLLDVSRVVRGRIELRMQPCDLCEIVQQTLDDYRQSLQVDGRQVTLECPQIPMPVLGDPTRLAQIIGNVLHNAAKFTAPGGQVKITLSVRGEDAVISVIDDGIGIAPYLLRQLFTPFIQAEQGLARSSGGLGLGLPLVKGLVELHGGGVVVNSNGMRGTQVDLHFPLSGAEAASAPTLSPERVAGPDGLRLLIIEDNRDSAETLSQLMRLFGHTVEVAFDGQTGLNMLHRQRLDAVICDIGLAGGMNGHDVARAVRADRALAGLHLIALSGYGQPDDLQQSREAGFDLHLVKPVRIEKLQAALARRDRRPAS